MPNETYLALPRELADDGTVIPREVAEDGRVFTEAEHLAIMANVVATETASLRDANTALEVQVATLTSEKAEAEKACQDAEAREKAAQDELAEHKAEIEKAEQLKELAKTSSDKMREVAGHLPAEYFTAEKAASWAKLDQASFDSLSEAIAQTAPVGTSKREVASTTNIVGAPADVTKPAAGDARALAQTVFGFGR